MKARLVELQRRFLAEVAERADCGILLDVNNVFVSASNHGFEWMNYVSAMPAERVGYIHLAGHSEDGRLRLDTHDAPVPDAVWSVYREAVRRSARFPRSSSATTNSRPSPSW